MRGAHTKGGKPGTQFLFHSLPPRHGLSGFGRQGQGQLLDRDRLVFRIASQQLGRPALGIWHDSVRLFQHAVLVEDGEYVRGLLGTVLAGKGQYAEAEANLSVALRLAPQRAEHHINMANVLLRTGRLQEAASHAVTAVRLAPNEISAANTMGIILFRLGDPRGALRELDRAIRLGADPVPAAVELNDMGVSVASRGHPAEAESLLRRAAQLDPSLVQAHRNLVLVLQDVGRQDEARAALRQAAEATGWRREYYDLGDEKLEGTRP
jgi:Flp pilus assembly protein TadD